MDCCAIIASVNAWSPKSRETIGKCGAGKGFVNSILQLVDLPKKPLKSDTNRTVTLWLLTLQYLISTSQGHPQQSSGCVRCVFEMLRRRYPPRQPTQAHSQKQSPLGADAMFTAWKRQGNSFGGWVGVPLASIMIDTKAVKERIKPYLQS